MSADDAGSRAAGHLELEMANPVWNSLRSEG